MFSFERPSYLSIYLSIYLSKDILRGVIIVSMFELHSRYNVPFRKNNHWIGMNSFTSLIMGKVLLQLFISNDGFDMK